LVNYNSKFIVEEICDLRFSLSFFKTTCLKFLSI
jgi:hypothetical protein